MKNHILTLVVLILIPMAIGIIGCKNKEEQPSSVPDQQQKTDSPEAKNYLPVLDFLKGEIQNVDSFYAGMRKITIRNGKTDSTFISSEEFHKITNEFVTNDLSKEFLEEHYNESSFMDHSTQSVTFTYLTNDHSLAIRRIDLLTGQTSGFDKLKSLFIEKQVSSGDTSILKRVFWKAGKNFLLMTQKTVGQNPPDISQVKVVWDFTE